MFYLLSAQPSYDFFIIFIFIIIIYIIIYYIILGGFWKSKIGTNDYIICFIFLSHNLYFQKPPQLIDFLFLILFLKLIFLFFNYLALGFMKEWDILDGVPHILDDGLDGAERGKGGHNASTRGSG